MNEHQNEPAHDLLNDIALVPGDKLLDRYKILEPIGSGGWGTVYRAVHLTLGSDVAIKVIHKHLSREEDNLKRLDQEAKLLSRLDCPNIVRVVDYGLTPVPFIVMEYFDGLSLSDWIGTKGPLPHSLAIDLFIQICNGLSNAETLGIVHRDLKPSNILLKVVDDQVHSKILDFGIAKLVGSAAAAEKITITGEVVGSPPYMPPEQWTGRCDHRSDIYSLGCIMYEAISGKQLFVAEYGVEYLNCHLSTAVAPIRQIAPQVSCPEQLEMVIRKCLQKSPKNRYQTSTEIRNDLECIKHGKKLKVHLQETDKYNLLNVTLVSLLIIGAFVAALWFAREPIFLSLCSNLNSQADKARSAGRIDDAIEKYKQIISLEPWLAKQDKNKLHAMRMLSAILKERNQWHESSSFDNSVNALTGSIPTPLLVSLEKQIEYQRDAIGNISSAETLSKQALDESIRQSGEHSLTTAVILDAFGKTELLKGDANAAVMLEEKALKIYQDLCEEDDPVLALQLRNLGLAFVAAGKLQDAEKLYKQAIEILSKLHYDEQLPSILNNLGTVLVKEGKLDQALSVFERAVEQCSKFEASPVTRRNYYGGTPASMYNNMAFIYAKQNKLDKAIEYFKKALDQRQKEGSDKLPDASQHWANLAEVYILKKDWHSAEECIDKAFKLRLRSGMQHPDIPYLLKKKLKISTALGKSEEVELLKSKYKQVLEGQAR
jgi:serine/threonine protein kinase/Tfp pilus assembly protein PilF